MRSAETNSKGALVRRLTAAAISLPQAFLQLLVLPLSDQVFLKGADINNSLLKCASHVFFLGQLSQVYHHQRHYYRYTPPFTDRAGGKRVWISFSATTCE
jgi:hypothetical protein